MASPTGPGPDPMPAAAAARSGNPVPEADVAAMFDDIAPVYDRLNTIMTAGADGRWRKAALASTDLRPGDSAIDVACGTGKLTRALAARVGPFGRVVGVDLAPAMVAAASQASTDLVQVEYLVASALALPFPSGSFDAATIAFGLRNLADFEAGYRELARVVRPGGRVVCLELTVPRSRTWATTYLATFRRLAPLAAAAFGHGATYRYLPASLDGFPDPDALARTMTRAGLRRVGYRRLGLGAVALHVGVVGD